MDGWVGGCAGVGQGIKKERGPSYLPRLLFFWERGRERDPLVCVCQTPHALHTPTRKARRRVELLLKCAFGCRGSDGLVRLHISTLLSHAPPQRQQLLDFRSMTMIRSSFHKEVSPRTSSMPMWLCRWHAGTHTNPRKKATE